MESRALAFINARLERVERRGAARQNPCLRRPDRGGQGDVDQDEDAVVANAVEEASERAGGACRPGDHAIEAIGDKPRQESSNPAHANGQDTIATRREPQELRGQVRRWKPRWPKCRVKRTTEAAAGRKGG